MSYELVFWKKKPGETTSSTAVYADLMNGLDVGGLTPFPVDAFLDAVMKAFSGAQRLSEGETVVWESSSKRAAFEVTWSTKHVRVDTKRLARDDLNRLVDIGAALGAPLYDPQVSERLDSWTDN